ncbi:MAG TPA: SUF system NifU family Fe-S cluster assembly protein [Steroidobacteraceae bacterium]|jgi:nitrogen fixation NifU-like protein
MDLADLYRDVIVDHNRRPRNAGRLDCPTHQAEGNNPLCGDRLRLFVDLQDDRIRELRFENAGCAISTASASLMSEAVKGRSRAEVRALFESVHRMLTQPGAAPEAALGKLAALAGVREYPARVKCASLCWHTLNAALAGSPGAVTTE